MGNSVACLNDLRTDVFVGCDLSTDGDISYTRRADVDITRDLRTDIYLKCVLGTQVDVSYDLRTDV